MATHITEIQNQGSTKAQGIIVHIIVIIIIPLYDFPKKRPFPPMEDTAVFQGMPPPLCSLSQKPNLLGRVAHRVLLLAILLMIFMSSREPFKARSKVEIAPIFVTWRTWIKKGVPNRVYLLNPSTSDTSHVSGRRCQLPTQGLLCG